MKRDDMTFAWAPLKGEGSRVFLSPPEDLYDLIVAKYPRIDKRVIKGIVKINDDREKDLTDYREQEQRETRQRVVSIAIPKPTGSEILTKVAELINGERATQHGDVVETHENIARVWTAFLYRMLREGEEITAFQVTMLMALLKIERTQGGAFNIDDLQDLAGYAGCAVNIQRKIGT